MKPNPLSLRSLFDALLDVAPDRRDAFFAERAIAPDLRARLERMLESRAQALDGLPRASVDELARGLVDEDEPEAAFVPGHRVGAFELIEVIGEGGSSTVFRARRSAEGVEQTVALKVLRQALYTPEAKRKFKRERSALGQLQHAGIAHLIEGGVTEAGVAYIALDFIDGTSITDYVRGHMLDLRARLALMIEVCNAVEAAHRALIVHRDLKPSNVLVTREGEVKLVDFGIAKLLDAEDDTQTRAPAFTPAYAAPEQRGDAPITTATDVYALGVLLGELVTGQRPNDGSGRTPSGQVAATAARGVLPASPATTRRQLRGDLDNVVAKAIAIEPQRRYSSAGAMADDLQRMLDGRPLAAHPPSALYRTRKFVTRHRGGVAVTVLFVLALLGACGTALWQAKIAREQAHLAREHADRADAVRRFMVGVFQRARPDENKGKPIDAHQLLEKGEAQVETSLKDQPVLQSDVLALLGQLYIEISDFPRAKILIDRSLDISRNAAMPADVSARALIGAARIEDESGAYPAAAGHAREALALLQTTHGAAADIALAHLELGHALLSQGDASEADTQLRAFIAQDRAALGDASDLIGGEWVELGDVLGLEGRYQESKQAFNAAIAAIHAEHGEDNNEIAHALNELSNMLEDEGDLIGAEAALRRALAIRRQTVGPDHHDTLAVESNLLAVIEFQGRFAEALPERLRLLERGQAIGAMHPQDVVATWSAVSRDYREIGRFTDARAAAQHALDTCHAALGVRAGGCASSQRSLGLALMFTGRYDEAEAAFGEALAIQGEHASPRSPSNAAWRADIGNVKRLAHHYAEAVAEIKQAVDAFPNDAGQTNPWRPVVLAEYAEALLDAGDADLALPIARQSLDIARKSFSPHHVTLGVPLFALARVELARGNAEAASTLLHEAREDRADCPADDPRILEIDVALAQIGASRNEPASRDAAQKLRARLNALDTPYARDLKSRLATASDSARAATH
jgi:eukaryotic-like serine/threonine-protein kinase